MDVVFKKQMDHYVVFVGNNFYCTCDTYEYREVVNEIKEKYKGLINKIKVV